MVSHIDHNGTLVLDRPDRWELSGIFLSGFQPVAILKGGPVGGNNKQSLRKVLVGIQLVLSIFLISSTLVMRNQSDFLQNKDLGFDKEQMAVIQLNVSRTPRGGGRMPERVAKGFWDSWTV